MTFRRRFFHSVMLFSTPCAAALLLFLFVAADGIASERETGVTPNAAQASPVASPDDMDAVQDLVFLGPRRPLLIRLHVTVDGRPFRHVWREYLAERFAQLDGDKDGFLDADETSHAPPLTAVTFGTNAAAATNRDAAELTALVNDSGGRISLSDYVAFYAASPAAPFSITSSTRTNAADLAIIELVDENADDGISRDELNRAAAALAARDFNDDQILDRDELATGGGAGDVGYSVNAITAPATSFHTAAGPVVMVVEGDTNHTVERALLAAYDNDNDERLHVGDEMDLDSRLLALVDADSDGQLDVTELKQFVHREPDAELDFDLGRVRSRLERNAGGAKNRDVRVRKRLNGFKIAAPDADVDVRRNNRDPAQTRDDLPQFRIFDRDKNEYLDENEAKGVFGSAAPLADEDADGKIFRAEFDAYVRLQAEAAATRLTLSVSDQGQGFFELFDASRDGRLTPRELHGAADLIAARDRNGDSVLDSRDIPRRIQLELGRGRAPFSSGVFAVVASNAINTPPPKDGPGPRWFHRMDTNQDGDVSRREFLGPADVFERLDADLDDLIDVEEAAAAEKD